MITETAFFFFFNNFNLPGFNRGKCRKGQGGKERERTIAFTSRTGFHYMAHYPYLYLSGLSSFPSGRFSLTTLGLTKVYLQLHVLPYTFLEGHECVYGFMFLVN